MRGATRVKWAVGVTVVALTAAACGSSGDSGGSGSSTGGSGGGIVRASWGDPQNPLEPANTNEVQGGKVLDMVFRGLKIYNPKTAKAENMIAQSITSTDSQNFDIKLKTGWTFSNGEPVNADSFINAWNFDTQLKNAQLNASFFSYIDGYDKVHPDAQGAKASATTLSGLTKVSDTEFKVRLNQKFALFPDTLGYAAFDPLPQAFFTNRQAWLAKPIGNGPYEISSYTKGSKMELKKWDGYKGPDPAQNGGVELRVYTDNNTAYTDLQAGNIDLVDDIPVTQLRNVKSDLGSRYINEPAGIIQTISFPLYSPRWSSANSAKVRQGLSMAINRQQITDQIFQQTRTPATDWTSPVLGDAGGYKAGLCGQECTFNASKAKQLIAEGGGLPGGRITISYNADTGSHKEWIDAVCNSINNALGNNKACVGAPVGTFADFRNRITSKQMNDPFRAGWQMDYPLIQDFLQPQYYTGASSNDSHYSNANFDKLVNQANAAGSASDSVSTFQKAEKQLVTDMPAIPLWYQNGSAGYSTNLSNVALNPFSVPVYNEIKVK
ncbi:peptide ABC transporter substrate-binding protein [Actinacidiphila paucisporea]|uniref:Peptide/nickel transport system substrate-binding protein/oligopeptide transport system substrate-binding protein n=1 Tax=Actinacidiphila paucisporea TaxID=310782 RepID=A0A1M6UPZ9_9ACTN|nr:ABC transporter substrate-binding protein [Actinacidiphila paucisporea]SHK71264.1 peptide/nickel transport system substrate-binding protein/oligopeptide transport system substrate-binding protein [Actinacidiphila paucisporea]